MSPANEHHDRAMELADQADSLKRDGQQALSIEIYRRALSEEEAALRLSTEGGAGVKTLSVLHRSAASLAMDCQDWTKARSFIERGLEIRPPGSIEGELKSLLKKLPPVEEPALDFEDRTIGTENAIGSDVEIRGSLRTSSDLVFNGSLEGEIVAGGELTLGKNADVVGKIRAVSVKIFGKIRGDVFVRDTCKIFSSALLIGDLKATRLILEEGASFIGLSEVVPTRSPLLVGDKHLLSGDKLEQSISLR